MCYGSAENSSGRKPVTYNVIRPWFVEPLLMRKLSRFKLATIFAVGGYCALAVLFMSSTKWRVSEFNTYTILLLLVSPMIYGFYSSLFIRLFVNNAKSSPVMGAVWGVLLALVSCYMVTSGLLVIELGATASDLPDKIFLPSDTWLISWLKFLLTSFLYLWTIFVTGFVGLAFACFTRVGLVFLFFSGLSGAYCQHVARPES